MRALVVALVVGLAGAGAAAAAPDRAVGFEHVFHDGAVTVTGAPSIPCVDCHALDKQGRLRGKPGHAACFGACHGPAPRAQKGQKGQKGKALTVPADREKVCAACHGKTAAVAYPPYTLDPDFGLTLSHAAHDATVGCRTCHGSGAGGGKAGGSHGRCTACHLAPAAGTSIPAMTDCGQCHAPAWGPARSAELVSGPFALAGFSHAGHAKKAKAAGCKSCHGAVAAATGADLPAPTMADCSAGGCHDGATAFATTEACTRCHTAAPTTSYELVRPDRRFSHERHRARLPDAACADCHGLDKRGEPASPRHRACSDAACHRDDFASRQPISCGACHVAIEPWRELRADALPPPDTEFGATMSHRRHAGRGLTCAGCHSLAVAGRELRPPRGHASCRGDGCHEAGAAAPSPALDDCSGCHRAGLVDARRQERLGADWSVRARFVHEPHPTECETCHGSVWNLDGAPATPAKSTCAGCHDGATSFKMTGHGCARCHGS